MSPSCSSPTRRWPRIFASKIKKWDDAAIKADNPGVTLPSTAITVARRADASGTTSNFTKFLAAAAPADWTLGSGDTVDWAADTQAGQGNPGVAQIVSQTDGAIGYVDLADATAAKLTTALIENAAGKFVAPTLAGAAAAVEAAPVAPDLSYSPINASGDRVVPDHVAHVHPRVPEADQPRAGHRAQELPRIHLQRR